MATPTAFPFELTGGDGGPVRGEVLATTAGNGGPAIIISHGFQAFRQWGFFPHMALRLARAGFAAVSFNFGSSGVGPDGKTLSEPDRFARGTFGGDLLDLATVYRCVVDGTLVDGQARANSIGLLGHSRGGGVSILHAAASPGVAAIVTWGAISTVRRWSGATMKEWRDEGALTVLNSRTGEELNLGTPILDEIERDEGHLDIRQAARGLAVPWLIVHGDHDETVGAGEALSLREACPSAHLEVIEGGGHTFGVRHPWVGSTPHFDRVMDVTVDWFVKHLL